MKKKTITTKELHKRMAQPLCRNCGKLQEEHIVVLVDFGVSKDGAEWVCALDKNITAEVRLTFDAEVA